MLLLNYDILLYQLNYFKYVGFLMIYHMVFSDAIQKTDHFIPEGLVSSDVHLNSGLNPFSISLQ